MSAAVLMSDDMHKAELYQTTTSGQLLATKLFVRPLRPNLVARPRLTALLDAGQPPCLILLSAPAGFGKTTLLAEWIGQGRRRACWLALDSADNDLTRFVAYLVAALQPVLGDAAGELADLLRNRDLPAADVVLAALVNAIALTPTDVVLVFDDYQVITSPAVSGVVACLLENLPSNLQLAILSRADPPIPIARLRSQGRVVELRAAELRFTSEEAATFLGHTMGLHLTPAQAAALDERTEGWIAGLQMAALSMRGRGDVDGFIRAFTGANRFILDFLVEEVLAAETPEVQAFLLQTAVLTRLCGPLCDAVTGGTGGRQMLERLERRNLFVAPLDDQRCWYRYHHLFADLLQARLHQSDPECVPQLRLRAAQWCERDGQFTEAVAYALAAKDYVRAGELVAACWPPVANSGEIETVWSWLSALPAEVVRGSAPLSAACCWVRWLRGQVGQIEAHLQDAELALDKQAAAQALDKNPASLPLLAELAALRSVVARYHGEFAVAIAHAERARQLAGADLPPSVKGYLGTVIALALATAYDGAGDLARSVDAYAETIRWSRLGGNASGIAVTYRLAAILRLLGRLDAAEAACRDALRYSEEQGMARWPAAGVLHLALAEVLLERNEVAAAEEHLARGSELGRRSGRLDAVRNTAPALVRLRLGRGDSAGALEAVAAAWAALGEPPSPLAQAELLCLKAKALTWQGSLAAAVQCVAEAERLAAGERGMTQEITTLAACRVYMAEGAPGAAARLAAALASAEENGRWGAALELHILRSLALAQQGAIRSAEADLKAALALAEPQGYVRVFLDEGEPLALMLRRLAHRQAGPGEDGGCSPHFLAALIAAFAAETCNCAASSGPEPPLFVSPAALIEPLSERELQVLRLMAAGLTNEQIAHRLILALGTVKAHIHNIAGKLGSQNRAHAVARAQELGLL